ncbi:MAG: hypothetical protein HY762_04350 [Planctomycetes bacterium]|nr:hypothetical protein [Planctomycetota bacterium]
MKSTKIIIIAYLLAIILCWITQPIIVTASYDPTKKKRSIELINQYFDTTDKNKKAEILESISTEIDPIPKNTIREFADIIYKNVMGGQKTPDTKDEHILQDKDYPGGRYLLIKKGNAVKYPLVIALHGGSHDMNNALRQWSFAIPAPSITICPQGLKKADPWWASDPAAELYVMSIFNEVKRSYPIDTNRVYIIGFSMGGWGAFCIGGHRADLFAGLAAGAGGLLHRGDFKTLIPGYIPNLRHTAVYAYFGAADREFTTSGQTVKSAIESLDRLSKEEGDYPHIYKEFPGVEHKVIPEEHNNILKWLFTHKRNPYPQKITWEAPDPRYPGGPIFYYIKLYPPQMGTTVKVTIKSNNSIELTATPESLQGVLTVFLNDKMVNLQDPLQVILNGKKVFSSRVDYSLSALLETIDAKGDLEMYFTAKIEIPLGQ